ncbi:hypothetical protein V6C53_08265 [Desulfocurvibacter africanus]
MGFLPFDRIVVRLFAPGKYIVVEGNRRVAAIKTILGDTKRKVLSPEPHILAGLDKVEVLNLQAPAGQVETASLLIQGVRHISGVRNWGPYQQGRLIHVLVDKEGMKQSEAALAVGLSPGRVGVLLRAFYGMQQMMEDPEFGKRADTSLLSCFEYAYGKLPVRAWLGWDDEARKYVNEDILRFFYRCIIPDESLGKARFQARDIRDLLPEVVENEAALARLMDSADITGAYALLRAQSSRAAFFDHIRAFLDTTENSFSGVSEMGDQELELLKRLHAMTNSILSQQ